MPRDAQGDAVSAASEDAVRAYDHAVEGYLTYRADTARRLAALLEADPEFGTAHVLKGCLLMAPFDATLVPRAREALADACRCLSRGGATHRERETTTRGPCSVPRGPPGDGYGRGNGSRNIILVRHGRQAVSQAPIRSAPPIQGRSTSGTATEPSAIW